MLELNSTTFDVRIDGVIYNLKIPTRGMLRELQGEIDALAGKEDDAPLINLLNKCGMGESVIEKMPVPLYSKFVEAFMGALGVKKN